MRLSLYGKLPGRDMPRRQLAIAEVENCGSLSQSKRSFAVPASFIAVIMGVVIGVTMLPLPQSTPPSPSPWYYLSRTMTFLDQSELCKTIYSLVLDPTRTYQKLVQRITLHTATYRASHPLHLLRCSNGERRAACAALLQKQLMKDRT